MSRVVVIGGGAAGMIAAIAAAENYNEVVILEKNEKLGKKIFITGKGRCNLTNSSDRDTVFSNIVTNSKFMFSSFKEFSNEDIVNLLNEEGIETKVERGNRVFPVSDKAYDVIEGLKRRLKKLGVEVRLHTEVSKLNIENNVITGCTLSNGEILNADHVIVATGGLSYKTTGSTGDGYKWANECGHNVTKLRPALVPLHTKEDFVPQLMGLSLKNIEVTFYEGDKVLFKDFGEMLFTHYGISGPVILSASSYIANRLEEGANIEVSIDLKPALDYETLDSRILRDFAEHINKDFVNSLENLLPKRLIEFVIMKSGIPERKKVNEITKVERENLVKAFKDFRLTITKTADYNEAIITQGGISIKEINPKTMESKMIEGLHFAGEVLDIDALTGGYNLQIAWSTGYAAGKNIY